MMKKFIPALTLLFTQSTFAAYVYQNGESCNLLQYSGTAWRSTTAENLQGKEFNLIAQPGRPNSFTFKVDNQFYSANKYCLVEKSTSTASSAAPAPAPVQKVESEEKKSTDSDLRNLNLRVSPVPLLIGGVVLDLDIGILESIAIGPSFSYFSIDTNSGFETPLTTKMTAFGLNVLGYLSGTRFDDSWTIGLNGEYVTATGSTRSLGSDLSGKLNAVSGSALIGYQWYSSSGFNFGLGAGVGYYSIGKTMELTSSNSQLNQTVSLPPLSGVVPQFDLTLGWAF